MGNPIEPGDYPFDKTHSQIGFSVQHLGLTPVRGLFTGYEGRLLVADLAAGSALDVTVDVTTVQSGNAGRDEHLQSADYFDSANHPTMTFRSTGFVEGPNAWTVAGELTLKGVTKTVPLTFEVNGIGENPLAGTTVAGFSGTASINRKDFNVNFEGVNNGLAVVADKIELVIDVEATLRPAE